jgi:hypothetical protein
MEVPMRRRPSALADEVRFRAAVAANRSIAGVLRACGLKVTGANYAAVKRRVRALGLETDHWTGSVHRRGSPRPRRALEQVLVEHSTYCNLRVLKRRLTSAGLLQQQCALCGLGAEWKGQPLTLVLDHVNGVFDDHRAENLRLLCPNCNSQQPTFAGRNKRYRGVREVGPVWRNWQPHLTQDQTGESPCGFDSHRGHALVTC